MDLMILRNFRVVGFCRSAAPDADVLERLGNNVVVCPEGVDPASLSGATYDPNTHSFVVSRPSDPLPNKTQEILDRLAAMQAEIAKLTAGVRVNG
jgi:hypothetical protein